jgi:hypothetical protein
MAMTRRQRCAIFVGIFLCFASSSAFADVNLTGVWSGNDGGTYYIRQIGHVVWWYGDNSANTSSFSNVAHGEYTDGQLYLLWADVTKGRDQHNGGLRISVVSPSKLQALNRTGSFGGYIWTKIR